jgi:hypothetical protein
MPKENTRLLHWPNKFFHGIVHFDSSKPHINRHGEPFQPVLGDFLPFEEALSTEHDDDAHCVFYCAEDNDELVAVPTLRKACYHTARDAGVRIVSTGFGYDYDTPGHVPMTTELLSEMVGKLSAAWEQSPELAQWSAWYTTRNGLRVMYLLDEPVDAMLGERYWIAIHRMYKDAGVVLDSLPDWTRRFRLPKVVRDGMRTVDEDLHLLEVDVKPLSLEGIEPANRKTISIHKTFTPREDYPSQEKCKELLYSTGKKGRPSRSRYHERARKLLQKTSLFDMLFEEAPLPEEERHLWLMRAFGIAVPILLNKAHASCEEIFALFYDPILGWDPASCAEDPHQHAWDCLSHVYGIEVQAYNDRADVQAARIEDSEASLKKMIEGMRTWSDAPEIQEGTPFDDQAAFVKSCFFANAEHHYYPLNEQGRYENMPVQQHQIIPHLKHCPLAAMMPELDEEETDGVTISDLVNNYTVVVQRVVAKPQQGDGGYITGLNSWNPQLVLPMYRRNPYLAAEYHEQVDGWLRSLFGENYEAAARWIGYALDFEAGAICAISIAGRPGVGKKLFTEGLGECLEEPLTSSGDALAAKHNNILMKTPFLVVNERWPKGNGMGTSPSDRFKELTAGDSLEVEPKFKSVISVVNPLRIILTANNHELLKSLVRGREQTLHDRKALGERILHFDVCDAAREYLWSIGGNGTTAQEGNRWIRGDSGQPSSFVVARHFMWLYENRPEVDKRQRFCVMGNCGEESAEMFRMATQSAEMPMVMRAVMVVLDNPGSYTRHYREIDGVPTFTMDVLLNIIRSVQEEKVSESALESCVEALSLDSHPVEIEGMHMWRLNMDMVRSFSRKWGIRFNWKKNKTKTVVNK